MNVFSRGVRNAFRNGVRTIAIVLILGLAIGLSLAMLVARQAVDTKISDVKASIGNDITVSPAGMRGFEGGGDPLTTAQAATVSKLDHVSGVTSSITDRVRNENSTSSSNARGPMESSSSGGKTSLKSSIEAGALGRRFNGGDSGNSSTNSNSSSSSSNDGFSMPISFTGTTDPTSLAESTGLTSVTLSSGEMIDGNSSDNVAIIGDKIASKNSLKVGDTFTAYGKKITVKGIVSTDDNTFAGDIVVLPLATLQNLSDQKGDITAISVSVDSVENSDTVVSEIKSALGDKADVTSDQERAESSIAPLESIKTTSTFSLIACVVAAAVIIFLAMLMIVRERRREIGVLKAIGATSKTVTLQFVVESLMLTLLAAVIGIAVGIVAAGPLTSSLTKSATETTTGQGEPRMNSSGLGSSSNDSSSSSNSTSDNKPSDMGGGPGGFFRSGANQIGTVTANVNWSIVLYGLAAALVVAAVGSVAASMLISRVRPAEAVRAE